MSNTPRLGQITPTGTIIAYGYYSEDYNPPIFSVMEFRDAAHRVPSEKNYTCYFLQGDERQYVQHFANIVEAANAYADDYGMDI
jgi:hypothetical protein